MNTDNEKRNIIDWTDRKEAMVTYRKYEELEMTGPCYQYYNGKLQPAKEPMILSPVPVPYRLKNESEDKQEQ